MVLAVLALGHGWLGTIETLLLFGALVVVPLGLPLVTRPSAPVLAWATPLAAVVLIAAFSLPPSGIAFLCSLPWLAVTLGWATRGGAYWLAAPTRTPVLLIQTIAVAWLPLAAAHITMSRAGISFAGIAPPLVELGGVHFTFAGFGATTLAACLVAASQGRRLAMAVAATVALIGGSSLVGLGHMTVRPIELVGTGAVTIGVVTLGALGWGRGHRAR